MNLDQFFESLENFDDVEEFTHPTGLYPFAVRSIIQKLIDDFDYKSAKSYMEGYPEEEIRETLDFFGGNVEKTASLIYDLIMDTVHA
jgi:hypothetical protein